MIKPMLAVAGQPHSRHGWLYEPKMDGVRAIATVEGDSLRIQGRGTRYADITAQYPELQGKVRSMVSAVFDCEIVVEDERGVASFPLIQRRIGQRNASVINYLSREKPVKLYAFDILALNNVDCTRSTLETRKRQLRGAFIESERARLMPFVYEKGEHLFEMLVGAGYEGVMAKDIASPYLYDKRSPYWQKFKPVKVGEFLAVGLTETHSEHGRPFGSIVLAIPNGDKLRYVGSVGSGLDFEALDLWQAKEAVVVTPEIVGIPTDQKVIRWLKPEPLKVRYFEMTEAGHLRFPRMNK